MIPFAIEVEELPDKNWNAVWEAGFSEIVIGDFCQIHAPFHKERTDVTHSIIIDPRMAFGTGHHETTRLVIKALQRLNVKEWSVLDFGSGTGVLAILAEKMGASEVIAVERDPMAFENLMENINVNQATQIRCVLSEKLDQFADTQFDLILANITRNVLIDNMSDIFRVMRLNSFVILSGFLKDDVGLMMDAVKKVGGEVISEYSENDWRSIIVRKRTKLPSYEIY